MTKKATALQDDLVFHTDSLGLDNISVEVLSDGSSSTVARVSLNDPVTFNSYTAVASSSLAEGDIFDLEVGRNIAVGRAIRQLGRTILSEGQTEVHRRDRSKRKQQTASEQAAKEAAKRRKAAEAQYGGKKKPKPKGK